MDAMRAAVYAMAFLELTTDDLLDPDEAVRGMGGVAAELRDCTPEERAAPERAAKHAYEAHKRLGLPKSRLTSTKTS